MTAIQICEGEWTELASETQRRTKEALDTAPPNTALGKFAISTRLVELLGSSELKADESAWSELASRRAFVEQQYNQLALSTPVLDALATTRERAVRKVLGCEWLARLECHANWLGSDEFHEGVSCFSKDERIEQRRIQLERVASLSPRISFSVSLDWAIYDITANPKQFLQSLDNAASEGALVRTLDIVANMLPEDGPPSPPSSGDVPLITGHELRELIATQEARQMIGKIFSGRRHMRYDEALDKGLDELIEALAQDKYVKEQKQRKNKKDKRAQTVKNIKKALRKAKGTKNSAWGAAGRGTTFIGSLWALYGLLDGLLDGSRDGSIEVGLNRETASAVASSLKIASVVPEVAELFEESPERLRQAVRAAIGKKNAKKLERLLVRKLSTQGARWVRSTAVARAAAKLNGVTRTLASSPTRTIAAVAGHLGNAIGLPLATQNAFEEFGRGDVVGTYAGVVQVGASGASLVALLVLGTTAGPALLVLSAVDLVAWGVGELFGETNLESEVMRGLKTLGILEQEKAILDPLTKKTGTLYTRRGPLTVDYIPRTNLDIGTRAKTATPFQKIALLRRRMSGWTTAGDEDLIFKVLNDTADDQNSFLTVIEGTAAKWVAEELEEPSDAATILDRTAKAYTKAGRQPGRAFNEQFEFHSLEHRDKTLNRYFDYVESPTSKDSKAAYHRVDFRVLANATRYLTSGCTDSGEEDAVYRLLFNASRAQLAQTFHCAGLCKSDIKSEIGDERWATIEARIAGRQPLCATSPEEGSAGHCETASPSPGRPRLKRVNRSSR